MIPGSAVDEFLARPLDQHLWVKGLSRAELLEAVESLTPAPRLSPKLRTHQLACFLLGVAHPHFCFWLSMGVGKTILTLELLQYWFQCKTLRRAIVFVTSDKAFRTWEKQFDLFGIMVPRLALTGSSENKWAQLDEFQEGIVLLPYPGAVAMVCQRSKKKKGRWDLDPQKLKKLAAWSEGFVLDESVRAANERSLTFKMLRQLRKTAKVRYALSGRPFGRDPTMLWPQYFLIDGGETLGETLGLFRAAFFTEKQNYWDPKGYAKDYKFKEKLKPKLSKMIQHRSITYAADECIELPKCVPINEIVSLPEEATAYYKRLVDEVIASKGDYRATKNVFLRMRQISSGFLGFKNDETGEKAEVEFMENPKLDRLLELLEELPEGYKAVVFYDFTFSGRKIYNALKDLKLKGIWLWSGTKDSAKAQQQFEEDPDCTVAVINNRLGAMSLDGLQRAANYVFFYESPVGCTDREQAERRLIRDGQKHTVFQYDMLVSGTVDEKIRLFHAEGADLFQALMKDPMRMFG